MWVSSSVCRRVCWGRVCLPECASQMMGEQTLPLRWNCGCSIHVTAQKPPLRVAENGKKGSRERKGVGPSLPLRGDKRCVNSLRTCLPGFLEYE